jgi:hypothetical protein
MSQRREEAVMNLARLAEANRAGVDREWEFRESLRGQTGAPMGRPFNYGTPGATSSPSRPSLAQGRASCDPVRGVVGSPVRLYTGLRKVSQEAGSPVR